ncbi:unnamed protein product, partial [Candidula unifasciata]
MGQSLVVVLNGYDLLKEALVTNEDAFNDRPFVLLDGVIGLAFANGDLWKEQKAITMTIFRNLGVHTQVMSERISEIAAINNDLIGQQKGQPIDLEEILTLSITNVVSFIMFGRCFEYDDDRLIKTITYIKSIIVDGDTRNLAAYFPCLSFLPGDVFKLKKIAEQGRYIMNSFFRENIQKCTSENIDGHNFDNYVTMYNTNRNQKLEAGKFTHLTDESLIMTVYHLFGAGMETTSTTLKWCILYFLHYPETQEKVYREIEQEVGIHRSPNMADKNQLNYLKAFIQETQRITSIFPLSVAHMCSKTTNLRGYTIPKGTLIIPNLDSVLHEKKIWGENLHIFNPERFLDNTGKVIFVEEFVPFSLGKRMCPGAAMARMQLFLFLSLMVQRFKFVPSEPGSLPSLTPQFGLTVSPMRFQVRALERN